MSKVIVISSGKGGVGKTTTAINLGAAMREFGDDVLIIDANLSTANVGLYLNSPEVPITLNNVLSKKSDVHDAVYEHESGIKIMPSSLSVKELKNLKTDKLKNFKEKFKTISDTIIIDSSAGLGKEAMSAIEMADELILVTNPEMTAIADALKTIKTAEQRKKTVKGIIVTKVKGDKIEMTPDAVKDMLESPVIGQIPEDNSLRKAQTLNMPVIQSHPSSKSARAYKEIAANLLGVEYNSKKDRPHLLKRIFRKG